MFELHETGDWDIFLGVPERARAETGGADQWALKRRECSGFARVNEVTSASLGYPLSVFKKNTTLKQTHTKGPQVLFAITKSIIIMLFHGTCTRTIQKKQEGTEATQFGRRTYNSATLVREAQLHALPCTCIF